MSTFHKLESFGDIQPIRVDGKAMSPGGNAGDRIGDVIYLFQQLALALQQAGQGAGNISKSDKGQTIMRMVVS